MKRLAIITTHPIQYNAPFFRALSEDRFCEVKVFYTWSQAGKIIFDPEFCRNIQWDIPLLEGYDYTFVENTAKSPGSHQFNGIRNPKLIDEIETWKADAVLIYGWAFYSHLKAMRYFHRKSCVLFRGDSTLLLEEQQSVLKNFARRLFLTWVYKHIHFALYVGLANKAYYLKHKIREEQLFFAPHAIDSRRFLRDEDEQEQRATRWRNDLGIKDGQCVFLFAAKLTSNKNADLLIRSFLALNNSATSLVIIGNGEEEEELKSRYHGIKGIYFLGFQNQSIMPIVYRLGDVFVLPSKSETWGLAVNEAMVCKRSIIVSDACGCSIDLVKSGENGYIFKSGNEESLTEVMRSSLFNHKAAGNKSFEIIQNWTYSETVKQIKSLFKEK